jgi:hypothetical protein
MPEPNKFSIWDALIPILGGAAAAYSPRYLGAGVQAGAGLYGAMQDRKYQQQRTTIEQAFRDQMLGEQKEQTNQAHIHNELASQQAGEKTALQGKIADAYVSERVPGAVGPPTQADSYVAGALRAGMPAAQISDIMPPVPAPTKPTPVEEPYGTGTGGIYNKQTGKWSVPPPTKTPAGPKPTNVEGQIIQLDREIRQIGEALKFADPDEEGELQAQLEDAKATRDALQAQRPSAQGGGSTAGPTVQVNIPGVHTDAGKRLAAKYLGK